MLCDTCHKNKATVHLTEIIDDQMTELHLCEECAGKKSAEMEQHFGLSDLLAGLADFGKQPKDNQSENLMCKNCNLTYADFKKVGRLGCSECYSAFRNNLEPLLKRIHGSTTHVGKAPQESKSEEKKIDDKEMQPVDNLTKLKTLLQEAIKSERFEEAAKLRDKIRELEKS